MKCKIASADLDTLKEKILCPKCKYELTLDDDLANYENAARYLWSQFASGKIKLS